MTAARQERKPPHSRAYLCEILAAWALVAAIASTSVGAATTELVVVNRYTGLAIDGFDPVAYFVDALPREGRAEWSCAPAARSGVSGTKATARHLPPLPPSTHRASAAMIRWLWPGARPPRDIRNSG
jgi:hypothetical protein